MHITAPTFLVVIFVILFIFRVKVREPHTVGSVPFCT